MLISYWSVTGFMPNWFFSFSSRKLVFSPVISVLLLDLCLLLIKHLLKLFFFFPLLLDVQSIIVWILMIPFDSLFNIFIWYYIYLICFLFLVFFLLFIFFEFVTFEFDGATINLFFLIIVGCALFCSIVVALLLSFNFFFFV